MNIKDMTIVKKHLLLELIGRYLIELAEETDPIIFLLEKWNTIDINGNKYLLKLMKGD